MTAPRRYRSYSSEFKQQVARSHLDDGVSKTALARQHGIQRSLVDLWVGKAQRGELAPPEGADAAAALREARARIAALERKVGQLTMELDALKGGAPLTRAAPRRSAPLSLVSGPAASPSPRGAAR